MVKLRQILIFIIIILPIISSAKTQVNIYQKNGLVPAYFITLGFSNHHQFYTDILHGREI